MAAPAPLCAPAPAPAPIRAPARAPPAATLPPFSTLTWNVLIGTPLPLVAPADFVPLLGAPGAGAARLAAQLALLTAGGDAALPDIIALQELHDDRLVAAFARAAARTHDVFFSRAARAGGAALFWAWRAALFAAFFAALLGGARAAGGGGGGGGGALAALALGCGAAAAALAARALPADCTAAQFLLSGTAGGLALLVRRGKFRALAFETRAFAHQAGDALNALKPRAYAALLLEAREGGKSGEGGARLLVLHAHASLGADEHRGRQMAEAGGAAAPAAVAALAARAGLRADAPGAPPPAALLLGDLNAPWPACAPALEPLGFADAFAAGAAAAAAAAGKAEAGAAADAADAAARATTWDARNPLTRGLLIEPDARIDHVAWRAGGGAAPTAARVVFDAPPFLSDHFGVRVDFAPAPKAAAAAAERAGVSSPAPPAPGGAESRSASFDAGEPAALE
jgi:endonuclease/exonuclease/phosphatase family metal-dependent hydrolase